MAATVLGDEGYDVAAVKLAGAGRLRDAPTLATAGADPVYDFVDAGLPSTVVPKERFRERMGRLLGRLEATDADVVVAEVRASPPELETGAAAVDLVEEAIAYKLPCASDPHGVVGLEEAYGLEPDLVSGRVTNTAAGIDLLDELTGHDVLDLHEESATKPLAKRLVGALE